MEYEERHPPPILCGQVAAYWTLSSAVPVGENVLHEAAPDGCIELIHRVSGESHWQRNQPVYFATGLSDRPAAVTFSPDARFHAIRLWPWAWNALTGIPCPTFADDWMDVSDNDALTELFVPNDASALLSDRLAPHRPHPIAHVLLQAEKVRDICTQSGQSIRSVQRWCADQLGMPPRLYLRLLRLGRAMHSLPEPSTLAEHAVDNGYADQAHMARDFRTLAGTSASSARAKAIGPFL